MQMNVQLRHPRRRDVLRALGAAYTSLALSGQGNKKRLWGIFPIAQTPFTESNKLDVPSLVEELRFIDRVAVHGFVWPQLASEWDTLTQDERMEGAEALGKANRELRPALVLGVQGPSASAAVHYARHAEKVGADAVISLPPAGENDPKLLLAYYKEVGRGHEAAAFRASGRQYERGLDSRHVPRYTDAPLRQG